MKKRLLSLVFSFLVMLICVPAFADVAPVYGSTRLQSLTHNCPNTGIMLPEKFSPDQTSYLLTVADWVSRVYFTPVAEDKNATISVNGQIVASGRSTQIFNMSDKPQSVSVVVSNGYTSTTYTVYLQRRPSEKRTRVSYGYINSITQKSNKWYLDADLVTANFASKDYSLGNHATITNKKREVGTYNYPINVHCELMAGTVSRPVQCHTIWDFMNNYSEQSMYAFVYIEDEIVAITPFKPD